MSVSHAGAALEQCRSMGKLGPRRARTTLATDSRGEGCSEGGDTFRSFQTHYSPNEFYFHATTGDVFSTNEIWIEDYYGATQKIVYMYRNEAWCPYYSRNVMYA